MSNNPSFDVAAGMAAKVADRVNLTVRTALIDLITTDGSLDKLTEERLLWQQREISELAEKNHRLEAQNEELRALVGRHAGGGPSDRTDFQSVVFAGSPDVPDLVKIGCAHNPTARYETKLGLTVLFTEPGGATRERQHHQRFASLRVAPTELPDWVPADGRTEWFRVDDELGDYIALRTSLAA